MKLALTWFAIALGLTSCSITHRSGEYACVKTTDCTTDRVCSDGLCIVPGGNGQDAPVSHVDAPKDPLTDAPSALCPIGCSSCNADAKECTISCGSPGAASCNQAITCPTGWSCDIACKNQGSCRSGISCTNATACHVTCSGANSCRNITCGDGPCNIECSGIDSCSRGISCGISCRCDVSCTGSGTVTCGDPVSCGQIACDNALGGCTSTPESLCSTTCP